MMILREEYAWLVVGVAVPSDHPALPDELQVLVLDDVVDVSP
jgi:hypothetical protein